MTMLFSLALETASDHEYQMLYKRSKNLSGKV